MVRKLLIRKDMRQVITIVVVGWILGTCYPLLADEPGDWRALINGTSIGLLGGILVAYFETRLFANHRRKDYFLVVVLGKTLSYLLVFAALILFVKSAVDSLFHGTPYPEYLTGPEFRHFLTEEDFPIILAYTFFMLLAIIFTRQMSRKLGPGVLFNFITGKYHRPRETERIFMFVDLRNSTHLAETLGDIQYHRLLNNFFWDITTCVVQGKGEIYRYVGDQVVISWKPEKGLHDARCIRTYYSIREELARQAPKYLRRYGVDPAFRASCHIGKVVAGELGNVKSQIVYIGDTLYIAGEIEKKCRALDSDFIVSEALVQRLPPQRGLFFQPLGRLPVEGRENGIALLAPVVA